MVIEFLTFRGQRVIDFFTFIAHSLYSERAIFTVFKRCGKAEFSARPTIGAYRERRPYAVSVTRNARIIIYRHSA